MPLAVRQRFAKSFELVAELVGVALSASGATLAAIFGKLLLAAVLGFIALGIILRLTSRRAKRIQPQQSNPRWAQLLAAAASIVEVAVIVEATDLPVRFSQSGFQLYHWGLVLAFIFIAYQVQAKVLRSLTHKRQASNAP